MAKQSKELESKIIGDDLCKLAELLASTGLCTNTGELNAAGNFCSKTGTADKWGYKFKSLNFNLENSIGGTIPSSSTEITIRFSINIEGINQEGNNIRNPLNKLFFNIEALGICLDEKSQDVLDVYCAWHFDKHIRGKEDGINKYSHPEYHFTFGGSKMEAQGEIYGSALIMPAPRIAYPPMDAVLGVDFILQNYFHKDYTSSIVRDPKYREIIRNSQARLWMPYAKSLISHWENQQCSFDDTFNGKAILPFLV